MTMRTLLTMLTLRRDLMVAAALITLLLPAPLAAQETIEYYGTDALGSVRVVFDANGVLLGRNDYLPYGEELATEGPVPVEKFTGQARDAEAGMDYFHARMYQPRAGRFNAVDPIYTGLFDPQQWNRYAYARNSPMAYVDPSGMYTVTRTTPDSNCRQSAGAYWCPGSFFAPNQFDPSSVDQIFDSNQQGYHGGQNDAAEQRYASVVATQFFNASQWGKGQLGGGQVSNNSRRTILSKQEGGETPTP
jgi:RHS repeat-associated protein